MARSRVHYSFTLHALRDADLIKQLDQQPNLSQIVREALRTHFEQPTRADLDGKLDEVLAGVAGLYHVRPVVSSSIEAETGREPEAARKALNRMVDKFRIS